MRINNSVFALFFCSVLSFSTKASNRVGPKDSGIIDKVSQSLTEQDSIPDFYYTLIATKNGMEKVYRPGTRFFIKYETASSVKKLRGFFVGVVDGKIVLTRKKKGEEKTLIPVEDITLLKKIKPGNRIVYGVIGTALVGGGAAILDNGGTSPGSALKGALLVPFIGIGAYLLCAVPVSLLIERLNEKKRSSGWMFHVQQQLIK